MSKPAKAHKLRWVRAARDRIASATLHGRIGFTCLAFARLIPDGHKAEQWYVHTSLKLMDEEYRYYPLSPSDFEGGAGIFRNPHRELWLAMLETLIIAGEI